MTGRPKIRESLVIASHTIEDRRLISALDPQTLEVTLLLPWEHAVLVLCDGSRTLFDLARRLEEHDEQSRSVADIERCLARFKTAHLIEELTPPRGRQALPRSRTVAELQQAYMEWHKEPARASQVLKAAFPGDPSAGGSAEAMPDLFLEPKGFIPKKGRSKTVVHTKASQANNASPFEPSNRQYDDLPPSELETNQVGFHDPLGFQEAIEAYKASEAAARPTLPMKASAKAPVPTEADPAGASWDPDGSVEREDSDESMHRSMSGHIMDDPLLPPRQKPKAPAKAPPAPLLTLSEVPQEDSDTSEAFRQTVAGTSLLKDPYAKPEPTPPQEEPDYQQGPDRLVLRDALQDAVFEGPVPSVEDFEEPTAELGQDVKLLAELNSGLLESPVVQGVRPRGKPTNDETMKLDLPSVTPEAPRRTPPPRDNQTQLIPSKERHQAPPRRQRRRRRSDDD